MGIKGKALRNRTAFHRRVLIALPPLIALYCPQKSGEEKAMKIMAGAPASGSPGDVRKNEAEAGRLIDRAKAAGADLLILPELCLTGAGCGGSIAL